ncbi:hypothetical protein CcaverHIS002_0309890 [Cutaneotrichosporon cavernicola]|uniref:Ricin B lectin domain-containing protein n=1 Tax=Cutaneotrichosporon cavernicola TaxID=279322 RepID=A0AA48KZT8_9TREE|nr:uncharacterized protein CcaverHIS019_0309740 [Cutaneotrichosporon cavernicola]BEI83121.1 hypothetical protein CcaverHIS002_0309890 [Cutaneotrichosporon cavernicola]BEI90904.1 hypothetical protein CcaverHIS019_0309740 [Cutaneotrichosporon cavernicola]BEI98683.1 hypothetical protein CcaverHIS631_0309820 [Cutaneotrichosporon cavernicola]
MLHLIHLALLLVSLSFAAARRVHPTNNTAWCIHALAVTPRSGTQLGVEGCTGTFRQEWNFFGSSSILQLKGTNLCAAPSAKRNGARVYLRDCPRDRGQWGEIMWHPAGGLRLSYDNTNFCLDNENGRLGMHNPVQIWDCYDGGAAQTWGFTGENGPTPPWQA